MGGVVGEPARSGLRVTEYRKDPDSGEVHSRSFMHTPLLQGWSADTPALKKVTKWAGTSAFIACGFCSTHGVNRDREGNRTHMCFPGYWKKCKWGLGDEPGGTCHVGDAVCKLTHDQQKQRGAAVESGDPDCNPTNMGCHGLSVYIKEVWYGHYLNGVSLPVGHAGPYGVAKMFCTRIMFMAGQKWSLQPWALRTIKGRASQIKSTLDFGRGYTCVVEHANSWVMEQWVHWLESWSVIILRSDAGRPVLTPALRRMWDCLRRGLLYFVRVRPLEDVPKTADEATKLLKRFGCLLERYVGAQACSSNLHMLVCRLGDQEAARGRVKSEYWIEHNVQFCKKLIDGRGIINPAVTLFKDIALTMAMNSVQACGGVQTFDERLGPLAQPIQRSNVDDGDGQEQLLGSGKALKSLPGDQTAHIYQALHLLFKYFAQDMKDKGWAKEFVRQSVHILVYDCADTGAGRHGIVHSMAYGRPKEKE